MRHEESLKFPEVVGVLGVGREAVSCARFLLSRNVRPEVLDLRNSKKVREESFSDLKSMGIKVVFGKNAFSKLERYELLLRSPWVALDTPEIQKARKAGVLISSQTELFLKYAPCKVVGVTGTKGKGTVSSLLFKLLERSYKGKVYLTGNIGNEVWPFGILPKLKKQDLVVFEMSSFQLEGMSVSPGVAIVLPIFPDHLDYHKSFRSYADAKANIVKFQKNTDLLVVNIDSEESRRISRLAPGKVIKCSAKLKDSDIRIVDSMVYLGSQRVCSIAGIQLLGEHNLYNAAIAVSAASLLGVEKDGFEKVIKNFKPIKHRLELVTIRRGIRFYNDSIATIPEPVMRAVDSFNDPVILLLGGKGKGVGFSSLAKYLAKKKNIKAIIAFGDSAKEISNQLKIFGDKLKVLQGGRSMKSIFEKIKMVAEEGDVVLLSPSATSYDMFENYQERGEEFIKYAQNY